MALINNCNICRKELSETEKKNSDDLRLPRLCEKHLEEIKIKLPKCMKLFRKMRLS